MNKNTAEKPKYIGQVKQLNNSQFVFEYWEGDNTLQAVGSEKWVDDISRLIMRIGELEIEP